MSKPFPMTRRRKRLFLVLLLGFGLAIAAPFILRATLDYLIYRHRFTSEMRVVAPDGSISFRPYDLFIEDKGHMVQAAFLSEALWPVHHISSGDHDYLFGPFGRVVILTRVGFHARAVAGSRQWSAARHSFPFSGTPVSEEEFLRSYLPEPSHEPLHE